MASITVQVGQCGNQVGHALLDALHTHSAPSSHFRGKERSIARAVLVDTEPKAVEGVLLSAKKWRYSKSSVVRTGSGGGASNNWGCGFAEHGPAFADATLEALRREAEACDHLMSIVLSQSAAGGTGSGLGTYITQIISDEYPRHTRINCVVCPNRGGEVIVQSYNMCLTLARLKADAHAIIALENEEISAVCKQVLKVERPGFKHLNRVIGSHVSALVLPAAGLGGQPCRLPEMIRRLVPHRGFPFLQPTFLPQVPDASRTFTSDTWPALLRRLFQMHITSSVADNRVNWSASIPDCRKVGSPCDYNRSVAVALVMRGQGAGDGDAASAALSLFGDGRLYPAWSPEPFLKLASPERFDEFDKSAALLANGQGILRVLEPAAIRAQEMYQSRAYVHQYTAHGLEDFDFEGSFVGMERLISDYSGLSCFMSGQ